MRETVFSLIILTNERENAAYLTPVCLENFFFQVKNKFIVDDKINNDRNCNFAYLCVSHQKLIFDIAHFGSRHPQAISVPNL